MPKQTLNIQFRGSTPIVSGSICDLEDRLTEPVGQFTSSVTLNQLLFLLVKIRECVGLSQYIF